MDLPGVNQVHLHMPLFGHNGQVKLDLFAGKDNAGADYIRHGVLGALEMVKDRPDKQSCFIGAYFFALYL